MGKWVNRAGLSRVKVGGARRNHSYKHDEQTEDSVETCDNCGNQIFIKSDALISDTLVLCNACNSNKTKKVEITMTNSLFKTVSIRTLAEIARVSYDGKGGFYHQELKDCASSIYQAYQRNTIVNKAYVLNVIKQLTFFKLVKHEWLGEVGDYSELYLAPTERGIEQLKKYYPDIMERIHNAYMEQQRKYAQEEFENEASLEDEAERRENVNNERIVESPAGIVGFRDGIE